MFAIAYAASEEGASTAGAEDAPSGAAEDAAASEETAGASEETSGAAEEAAFEEETAGADSGVAGSLTEGAGAGAGAAEELSAGVEQPAKITAEAISVTQAIISFLNISHCLLCCLRAVEGKHNTQFLTNYLYIMYKA